MTKITIITLQLLAFVLLTSAKSMPKQCSNLPPKQNFNPLPYFYGKWYTTYAYVPGVKVPKQFTSCASSKGHLLSKHFIREVTSAYLTRFDTIAHNENFISMSEFIKGRGKYNQISRTINTHGDPLSPFFESTVTILDTDYKSYALIQTCIEINGKFMAESFAIMSRKQDTEIPIPNIEEMLQRFGLKLTDFESIEVVQCKQDPDMKYM